MKIRALEAVALAVGLAGAIGLAAYLEMDRASGRPVWVAVENYGPAVNLSVVDAPEPDWVEDDPRGWARLEVNADDEVIGWRFSETRPTDGVAVRSRNRASADSALPLFPAVDPVLRQDIRWAGYRISASGEAYLVGVADQDKRWLGPGDSWW